MPTAADRTADQAAARVDRRLTPATARVAHSSLRGVIVAPMYTEGQALRVLSPYADLLATPGGARDRQLLQGDRFVVVDRAEGHAFGRAQKDGYCGWVAEAALADLPAPTHRVVAPATHLYPEPRVQAHELVSLSLGALVTVTGPGSGPWVQTSGGFIPATHLSPVTEPLTDAAAVAESLLGTPYLWGGNTRGGIDCSGLVQGAHLVCGIACPADSDLIQAVAEPLSGPLRRSDLLFWKGHVAMIVDEARLIHANGHSMSVAYEDTAACIARIAAQGGGPVTQQGRLAGFSPPA